MDKHDITRAMLRGLVTPPEIEAQAQRVLGLLVGMSFADATHVLGTASEALQRSQSQLLRRQKLSLEMCQECFPKGGADRP